MASGGLFALLDDLASLLDDISVLSKVAVKNAAGVAGDDLAVGAQQMVGLDPSRELPIVWAITKGSLLNKCVLVPLILALGLFLPQAIQPLLLIGGLFFCYEGMEKVLHARSVRGHLKNRAKLVDAVRIGAADLLALEKEKIHDAIKTDSILSAEIVVIANAAMLTAPLLTKALALSAVSIFVTIAIYGTVAMIVKADDIGLHLSRREGSGWRIDTQRAVGRFLLQAMPPFLKAISVVGTLAMLMVGGGILVHHVHLPTVAPLVKLILTTLLGMSAGLACIAVVSIAKLIYSRATAMRPPQE